MNKIILLVLFVFSYCVGSSQAISQRSTSAVTVQDARLFAQYNFRPPVFSDTIQANLQIGLDSCGALIFSRDINAYYYRACSPKRWVAITSGGGSGNSWNIGGNASPSSPNIGTTTVSELDIITNGIARTKIKGTGIARSSAARNKYLMIDTTEKYLYYGDAGVTVDTISLSNRINLKIDSLKRISDSVFAYKNGTKVFQFIDSVGGGGVGGNGTQYYVPKWSTSTVLTNSQIYDKENVGINTQDIDTYKLNVLGNTNIKAQKSGEILLIQDSVGNDILKVKNDSTIIRGGTIPLTIIGNSGVQATIGNDYFASPQNISRYNSGTLTFYNTNRDGNGFNFDFANSQQSISTASSMINLAGIYNNQQAFQFSNLLISPTYNFDSTNITSSAIARGIYYNPTIPLNGLRSAKHIAFESTSGNVIMKGLKKSSSTTDSIAIWINDTLSKAPYPSKGGVAVDTIYRTLGNDSIFYKKNGNTYAIKDSVGTNPSPVGYYGAFQDTTIQTAVSINTPYAMKLGVTDLSNGVSIVSNSRIKITTAGIYNIQFSAQFDRTNSGTDVVDIWLRKNGTNVVGSGGKIVLTGGAVASAIIATWNYVLSISSNDFYEIMWSTPDTRVRLLSEVAQSSPFIHPQIPSVIVTVTQQSGIMAGTGISPLDTANMLSNYARINLVNTKLNISDTANMLSNYSTRINGKLNISDTANMLSNYSTRINGKLNISDTANMLSNYSTRINGKLNISDTANMLSNYSTRINGKLNIGDANQTITAYQLLGSTIKAFPIGINSFVSANTALQHVTTRMFLCAFYIPQSITVTGVKWITSSIGTSFTPANYNGFALYSYNITTGLASRIDTTVNDGTIWGTAGFNSKAFAFTYSLTPGIYYIGAMCNGGGTLPSISQTTTMSTFSSYDFTPATKLNGYLTGTLTPTSFNISSAVGNTNLPIISLY